MQKKVFTINFIHMLLSALSEYVISHHSTFKTW